MRLFIKWRFYFILFEVVTVSNQIESIRASRYPGTCFWDCPWPPTQLPPRHLKGHLAPGAWAVTKECGPHCPAARRSRGEGCALRADGAGEGALHNRFAPAVTWPQTQLSCFAHKPRTMGSLDSAVRFASVKCYSFHARGLQNITSHLSRHKISIQKGDREMLQGSRCRGEWCSVIDALLRATCSSSIWKGIFSSSRFKSIFLSQRPSCRLICVTTSAFSRARRPPPSLWCVMLLLWAFHNGHC